MATIKKNAPKKSSAKKGGASSKPPGNIARSSRRKLQRELAALIKEKGLETSIAALKYAPNVQRVPSVEASAPAKPRIDSNTVNGEDVKAPVGQLIQEIYSIGCRLHTNTETFLLIKQRLSNIGHHDSKLPESKEIDKELNVAAQVRDIDEVCGIHTAYLNDIIDHLDSLFARKK